MAAGVKLVCEFQTETGATKTFTYNYADPEVTTSTVRALVNGLIANGSIFDNPPKIAKSAKLVTTTETPFNLEG